VSAGLDPPHPIAGIFMFQRLPGIFTLLIIALVIKKGFVAICFLITSSQNPKCVEEKTEEHAQNKKREENPHPLILT